jgi:hypothetical protein
MKKSLSVLFIFIVGCNNFTKKEVGLPFDIKEKNIAALFTMTNESGRIENLKMMESIFQDGSLGFEFQSHHNKTSKYIYEKAHELSKKVGEHGTLLLYLNSHGGGSGNKFGMTASDEFFKFSKILKAISAAGGVYRLIVLIDTCHASGGIREGFEGGEKLLINIKTGLPELPDIVVQEINPANRKIFFGLIPLETLVQVDYGLNSGAYKEALIIASSSAEDLSTRGAFAIRLKKAFEQIKNDESATVGEFLKKFAEMHSNTTQKPYYKALPNSFILDEPLFYNSPIREISIKDMQIKNMYNKYNKDYIPLPIKHKF